MSCDPEGCEILADKPRVTASILPGLASLPPHTLGHHYAAFMTRNNISPDSRSEVRFVDDPDLAYVMTRYILIITIIIIIVMTRYRETHDMTHAILGQDTTMVGEVLVKWVEALQFRLPMCAGGAIFGPLRFKPKQRDLYRALLPWALDQGLNAKFLLNVYYEKRWEQDINEFRKEFNISVAPS